MKKNILLVVVTAIICIGVTSFAYAYDAVDVGYRSTNVKGALDNLYSSVGSVAIYKISE